jgi:protein SCO1/2
MKAKMFLGGTGLLVLLLLVIAGTQLFARPYTFRGSLIDPPMPSTDFVLEDQHGADFRLSAQQGKVVVMTFGYTSCPDVCPTTLADFKRVQTLLGDQADQVQFVFVTVDPERDTPERLEQYMTAFDPAFRGLHGDMRQLEHIWESYGVYHEQQEVGSAAGYLVDHTSRIYVVDTQGNLRLTFPFGATTEDMAQDIRHLAEEA